MIKPLCKLGLHKWEISRIVNDKGRTITFSRMCDRCDLEQQLQPTKEYSAGLYVWTTNPFST